MQWVQIALQVFAMIVKYGPSLWKLGVEAYKIVESIITSFKGHTPEPKAEEVKALADKQFDQVLVKLAAAKGKPVPAEVTRVQLRRDVWATRKENFNKVRLFRKPT